MSTVIVNGTPRPLEPGTTVADVVATLLAGRPAGAATGVAVAVDDQVVPRAAWAGAALAPGARVEVLTAMQGG